MTRIIVALLLGILLFALFVDVEITASDTEEQAVEALSFKTTFDP